jgi:ABC-type phosphate transport system ATPase subunit
MGQQEVAEVKRQKTLLDAKITIAQEEVSKLVREKEALNKTLWMEVTKAQVKALLEEGSCGKTLQVVSYWNQYSYDSWASLAKNGELLIGGYTNHDHFSKDTLFIRKDLGRY